MIADDNYAGPVIVPGGSKVSLAFWVIVKFMQVHNNYINIGRYYVHFCNQMWKE